MRGRNSSSIFTLIHIYRQDTDSIPFHYCYHQYAEIQPRPRHLGGNVNQMKLLQHCLILFVVPLLQTKS